MPSGKPTFFYGKIMKNHHFPWVNPLFQWPFPASSWGVRQVPQVPQWISKLPGSPCAWPAAQLRSGGTQGWLYLGVVVEVLGGSGMGFLRDFELFFFPPGFLCG
jgi:hypothetical protein